MNYNIINHVEIIFRLIIDEDTLTLSKTKGDNDKYSGTIAD